MQLRLELAGQGSIEVCGKALGLVGQENLKWESVGWGQREGNSDVGPSC